MNAHALIKLGLCSGMALALGWLSGCQDAPAPVAAPAQPIIQNNQIRYPADHPQLALLNTQPVETAQQLHVELPAKLVWNEERTQRIYCLLYTSPSPRDGLLSRMPSSA